MFLDSDDASSFEAKPMMLTHAGKFIHLLIVWYILSNFLTHLLAAAWFKCGRQSSLSIEVLSDTEYKPATKKMKGAHYTVHKTYCYLFIILIGPITVK